jgi:predicted AAA+ superfamily ATPase
MLGRPRLYETMLREHLAEHRQMALVSGPRQVGKTTVCRALSDHYLNWDNPDDRRILLAGPARVAEAAGLDRLRAAAPVITLDELHKYAKWKGWLKGLFDSYGDRARFIVTGSSRLDVFKRGGDSLMGRYFLYRMHPWSVAECVSTAPPEAPVRPPAPVSGEDWEALRVHGGFPEPFLKRDPRFTRRWRALRHEQLAREDLRDVTRVQELGTMELLMQLLAERSGGQLVYAGLAREIGVTIDTVKRWIDLLERLHYGFLIRPWFKNVTKALVKEPKWFLRDWSGCEDAGARSETLVACHLLKAVDGWNDLGLGRFELRYLRDKLQREVDFLIVRERKPWCLVEVKTSDTKLSPWLAHFQSETGAPHALQVVMDLPFEGVDCFQAGKPAVVSARDFLSQLL